jgi:thiol-disulfide isomerase/thioredoxin
MPVLLNFWATWCPPCVGEMPYLQEIYDERTEDELLLLCINVGESPEQVGEFLQENELSLPVILDMQRSVAASYNITAFPTTYFIDKDGIIRGKVVGAFRTKASIERYIEDIIK